LIFGYSEPIIPDHILNAAAAARGPAQPQLQVQSTVVPPTFNPRRRASLTAIEGNNRNPPPPLFTPNASPRSLNSMKLRKIQGAFSVDTTTVKAPQDIYNEIERVLTECNIHFKVKNGGCVFKCKYVSFLPPLLPSLGLTVSAGKIRRKNQSIKMSYILKLKYAKYRG
jgi:hypothetical protein